MRKWLHNLIEEVVEVRVKRQVESIFQPHRIYSVYGGKYTLDGLLELHIRKLARERVDEIVSQYIKDHLEAEELLDDIVSRLKRKQLK